ncbi:hypothetical protein F2Y93_22390 [Aphanizomenon flos-aquae CCAP 1446/1C]|nr:hypothetical protein [Anabaena sp. CCAP 1446/1C]
MNEIHHSPLIACGRGVLDISLNQKPILFLDDISHRCALLVVIEPKIPAYLMLLQNLFDATSQMIGITFTHQ